MQEGPTGHLQLHELSQNQLNQFINGAEQWEFINGKTTEQAQNPSEQELV